MPFIVVGIGVRYTNLDQGEFECPNCGPDRGYYLKQGTYYFTLFFIPIVPIEDLDEIVECQACRGRFRPAVLVKRGDASAVDMFMEDLRDKDYKVRESATYALARIGKPAVKPLLMAMKDDDWNVRREAAEALGLVGDPGSVMALIGALEDSNFPVQATAADALGRIGDARAIEPLSAALKNRDLAMVAGEALSQIRNRMNSQVDAD